jgi:hypothetical protein
MNAFAAYLVADHLQDLLREADAERRAALARTGRSTTGTRHFAVRLRVVGALRRVFRQPAGTARPRPAGA